MITSKKEHKTALLISPQRILTDHVVLKSLHITKSSTGPEYSDKELEVSELNNQFIKVPKQGRDVLLQFNKKSILDFKNAVKKKFTMQRTGIAYDAYYQQALKRKMHELFESFKPFSGLIPWYQKVQHEKSKFKTGPCSFSPFKPQLQFEVKRENDQLKLHTLINVNGTVYAYSLFTRYHFLLESNHEYFLLSYKDYQTLEWLHNENALGKIVNPDEFAKQILARLENDYPVNRNNLLAINEIVVTPENRVLLSEISQKFLVFTPQWLYDGFLVEGAWKEVYETTRNGETYRITRNRDSESAFLRILESLHSNFPNQMNGYYYLSFEEAQKKNWFLKVYHQLLDMNFQLVGMDMLQHFRYSSHKISFESGILTKEINSLTLEVKVLFGKEEVLLQELQKMLLSGQRSLMLKDGSIGIIQDEFLEKYEVLFRHGKISGNKVQLPKWFAFSEQEAPDHVAVLKPVLEKSWWQKWQHWHNETDPLYPLPSVIRASLRPYQQKGFEWMKLLSEAGSGACLADDMGLGKTLQTICFLAYQLEQHPDDRHLIVCPSSLIFNWQQELEKFAPGITSIVHHGSARNEGFNKNGCQVIITSYGTLRVDIDVMSSLQFRVVVLDESHNIKNPVAQVTRAVGQLRAVTRIALSGTPVMNNTFDLFAQLNFICPGMFANREFFKREYADSIDRDHNAEKLKELKKITAPFVLRRTKQQVATDLPAKTEMVLWCTMNEAQKSLYEEIKTNIRDSLFLTIKNDGLNKSKLAVLQGMMKLRQLCNSPLLLPPEEQNYCTESVKTDLLIKELYNLKDHKVLVFSQFTQMLHLLAEACNQQGIAYYHFDGQTPPAKRSEMVARFQQEDDQTNVFFISLKAGNSGLNLTAADYVFLYDPWWNTAVQQQAIDRTHRIGQTKNVFAYKMICKDTIEEKIIEIQERKKQLADELVSEDEGFVKTLTEHDIAYLFS